MSTGTAEIKCPQCGYEGAEQEADCNSREYVTRCGRCGYKECMERKRDENGYYYGWEHEVSDGAGSLFYCLRHRLVGHPRAIGNLLHTRKEVADAEEWLRDQLQNGLVDPAESYLTRWNDETNQVETVIGSFKDSRGELSPPNADDASEVHSPSLKLFSRVTPTEAEQILAGGFKDHTGTYTHGEEWTGVWVSDRPRGCYEDVPLTTTVLLGIELPVPEAEIEDWQWGRPGETYREWLLPAELLNTRGSVRVVNDEEEIRMADLTELF